MQAFAKAIEILRKSYFPNAADATETKRRNIALMTDLGFVDSILKATILQTIANTKNGGKNRKTFLFRFE